MDLIVTHTNADFDALSSLVAASKLYPKARLLLPGSQERAVRSFMSLIKDKIRIETEKTCRMDDVKRLIIVDNRHKSRIGEAASLVGKKGLEVHIYDHHPRSSRDIKGKVDIFKEVGATVSILLEVLLRKNIKLTPLEATLMLLGIYEETGSLSYATTTKLDVDMVSKLLEKGANLNAVSSYLNRELSGNELSALIKLLESIDTVDVNGTEIAFASVESDQLDGEMGTVVHKLQDVENFPVVFALFKKGEKVKILARSRTKLVDVNKLLQHFDGGGHSSAAYAKVEGKNIKRVKSELVKLIDKMTSPDVYAKDIMSSSVKTFSQEEKVKDVAKKLKSLEYRGAPVLDEEGKLTGIITIGDLHKAIKRKMGHSRIKGYMAVKIITAAPNTPLFKLREIMLKEDKGRIPVIKDGKLVGLVTRTDVLKRVHSSFFAPVPSKTPATQDISKKMKDQLPPKLFKLIKDIGRQGDKMGMNVFVVGGFIRDIILDKKNFDLDVVIEGDAIKFGRILADKIDAALVVHRKFGTCTLVKDWPKWLGPSLHPDNKFKIDVATARKEVYERPAALPTVEFSSLRDDLYRRDFTINAMAVNVNKDNFGLFVDFFGGIKDLEKGIIRILHDMSFIDDPTRIFRAVRFEQRFGFRIESHTEYLITHAVKKEMFKRTENQRIRDELILMLKEENPEKAVFRMKELHELRFIHPNLVLKRGIRKVFKDLRKNIEWYSSNAVGKRQLDKWLINLMVVLEKLSSGEIEEVLVKFVFTRSASLRLKSYNSKANGIIRKLSFSGKMAPSQVYETLELLSHELILYAMSRTSSVKAKNRIKKFFKEYNGTKLRIKGEDVIKAGVKPGPKFRKLLRLILCQRIDGKLKTKKDELEYLKELLSRKR